MDKQVTNINSVVKLWEQLGKDVDVFNLQAELDVYKKLLQFFQVGDYYYLIFNLNTVGLDAVSPNIKNVLGYDHSEVSLDFWLHLVHPDDMPWFAKFEPETAKFLYNLTPEKIFNYKVQYDLRLRRKDGKYVRILIQVLTIQQNDDGGIHRTLSLHTDITHLKPHGNPKLSFIGLNGESSFIDVQVGKPLSPFKEVLTKRQKEIILQIMLHKVVMDGVTGG